jgi:hypothetical protein
MEVKGLKHTVVGGCVGLFIHQDNVEIRPSKAEVCRMGAIESNFVLRDTFIDCSLNEA